MSAIAVMVVLHRLGVRRFLRFPALLDVAVTALLTVLFIGTFGGMVAAISGGLFFSALVSVLRVWYGIGTDKGSVPERVRAWTSVYC